MISYKVKADKLRYSRQIALPEIGKEGQLKILNSKVLVIGCGALGSMVAMQIAGAGVGTIGIADYDTVDLSNLQRQFFYTTSEAGISKAGLLRQKINNLNPGVKVILYNKIITSRIGAEMFPEFDFIVDATDNPESKRMIGEMAASCRKPCCIGGVKGFEGQVMTFMPDDPRFEDFFGEADGEGFLPCSIGGVFGPAAALCASIQASEVIKCIIEKGEILSGKIFMFNLLDNTFRLFRIN
ncbi:MAG: HesA/MoeB/ThiF family protein [Muribaculaceae bacterium]|nr:HesA/MoeB/ThiF family protein [Muribaculaceae bacterium]